MRPAVVLLAVALLAAAPAAAKAPKRFPCDPKFGNAGNYLELTVGSVSGPEAQVSACFGAAGQHCLDLAGLPGRSRIGANRWSPWSERTRIDRDGTTYQFALCGSGREDLELWQRFHQPLGAAAWDSLRLRGGAGAVHVKGVRVVQNRVRILDDERPEEGAVNLLLGSGGMPEIPLAERIRRSKLNRVACLNTTPGAPYCDARVPGLEPTALPPVIARALLELGHSGSEAYGRSDDAYCSEFALFVIEQSVGLAQECREALPDVARGDISANHLRRWLDRCGRVIAHDRLRDELRPGDYLSVGERKHSTLFLGWADPDKQSFWELSGNNQCRPELEGPAWKTGMANMVCIALRDFATDVTGGDFGGRIGR